MVLECVESSLAKKITKNINIPTIGIGASNNCDGQVLVTDDLIGLNPINVRFVKKYSCLLYTSPSPRDGLLSRMPSSA